MYDKKYNRSKFKVASERVTRETIAAELLSAQAPSIDASPMREKLNILAVDDKADVLNTIKAMLSTEYNVYAVTSGAMALKFLSRQTADLILLDVEMPDMNGYEVLKQIQNSNAKLTPIIFLTGNATIDNIFMASQSKVSGFVVKPVDRDTLLEKIANCLHKI